MPYIDPATGSALTPSGEALLDGRSGEERVPVLGGIPRFVEVDRTYAESFGWQWKRWDLLGSGVDAQAHKRQVLARRTRFTDAELEGKTLLECGCGRGDDTIVLTQFPVAEIHAVDLSTAVEAAADAVRDPRVAFAQASIFELPFPPQSFDVVYCHRVLQHTPDPVAALRAICRMVKPGGTLFAHSYKRSFVHLSQYKYKYRPLTTRMRPETIVRLLDRFAPSLFALHERTRDANVFIRYLITSFVPFERIEGYDDFDAARRIEIAKLVTFDALTPRFDRPMSVSTFRDVIESEGLRLDWVEDSRYEPVYGRASRPHPA